jgi:dethiobiotin synthetase
MLAPGAYFVAGTDTEIGKSFSSVALLRAAADAQWRTQAFKPISAGCSYNVSAARWENEDAVLLQAAATESDAYEVVNPAALKSACSPHIAAKIEGREIDPRVLAEHIHRASRDNADLIIVEGAGGWYAPLSDEYTMADLALNLGYPVILVVGLRLGCLNHAKLTEEAIRYSGLQVAGWIGCQADSAMPYLAENLSWIKGALHAPFLGFLPWVEAPEIDISLNLKHLFGREVEV